jgi:hypothetical protein
VAVVHIMVGAGLLVYALWLLIQGTRQGMVRWATALKVAAPGVVLYPVGRMLLLGMRLKDYNTAKPLETFRVESLLDIVTGMLGTALVLVLAGALIATFYPRALEELRRVNRRIMGLDAVVAAMAAAGIGLLLRYLQASLLVQFHSHALLDVSSPESLASAAPWVAAVTDAIPSVIQLGAAVGLIAMMIFQVRRRWMTVPAVMLALVALVSGDVHTAGEFALEYGMALSMAAAAIAFCWFFGRKNYLAYALVLWLGSLVGPLAELMGTARRVNAWAIIVVMAVSLIWAAAPALRRREGEGGSSFA